VLEHRLRAQYLSIPLVTGDQFSLNAPSSAGARVNFIVLQSGIG
jgi:hypothetical protein